MAENMSTELMAVSERPRVINKFVMPEGTYEDWNDKQAYEAELLAKLFANTYIRDFSAANAALRLGARSVEQAQSVGTKLANHWLTMHYIRQLIDNFGKTGVISADSVSALLWRDASDFEPGANPVARVNAQKCLAMGLGLTETQAKRKVTEDLSKVRGGVIWVEAKTIELPDWEQVSLEAQAEMMAKLEDDTPVEGEELL